MSHHKYFIPMLFFPLEKKIQALLRSIREKEKIKEEEVKVTYQRMFSSGSNKQQSKQSNGFDHPDPVVIRSNVSARISGAPVTDLEGPCGQGPKFIQVASADEEAPCWTAWCLSAVLVFFLLQGVGCFLGLFFLVGGFYFVVICASMPSFAFCFLRNHSHLFQCQELIWL